MVIFLESTLTSWEAVSIRCGRPLEPYLLLQATLQSVHLENDLHHSGDLLPNNPSALAMHECKCLWPHIPLECLGHWTSWEWCEKHGDIHKLELSKVINSATDREETHIILDDLLYYFLTPIFRFNLVMRKIFTSRWKLKWKAG